MILIRCVILLLYGLCNAQIRDKARLNLISTKVEALEKIVTSLENKISKLEVNGAQRTYKFYFPVLGQKYRIGEKNWYQRSQRRCFNSP